MKTEDETLNEILVDALASALTEKQPLISVEEFAELTAGSFYVPVRRQPYTLEELDILAEQAKGVPIHAAIKAVTNEIKSGTTDFDEIRVLAAKHIYDVGSDPNDLILVDVVLHFAEMAVHGTQVIGSFERLVA